MSQSVEESSFWESKYQAASHPWDLGEPTPPLVDFFQQKIAPSGGEMIVLGCGLGQDAVFLAEQGLSVTAVDFAPSAIATTTELASAKGVKLETLEQDIFSLSKTNKGSFDYLFEHTCFCAIAPSRRQDYVGLTADLLRPNGKLYGIFFTHNREGGPPFGITPSEIREFFSPYFELETLTAITNSIPRRQGEEHWGVFRRKA